jgi:hypothetical protein
MRTNKITLLAICFALFIAPVGGNQHTINRNNAVAKTVRVRLTEVETNADIVDWPSPGSEIIIKTGATIFNKKTGENGIVVFDAVPCGQQIVIIRKDEYGGEDGVFHRRLPCTRRQVDLGIIERAFGGKYTLRQRKLQRMGFDATRNVWRDANGKIIPMRTFRRIMAQRQ